MAASGRKWPLHRQRPLAANCGQPLRPFAATRSHSSGRKWPRVAAPPKWPQVAASGRKWPQVAAPDKSERVAASGREWPLSAKSISTLKATPLYIYIYIYEWRTKLFVPVIATGKTGSSPIGCEDFRSLIISGRKCCSLH